MSQFRLYVDIPFKTQSAKVPSRTIDNLNNPLPNKAIEFIFKTFAQRKVTVSNAFIVILLQILK